jgi:hypothetical protein
MGILDDAKFQATKAYNSVVGNSNAFAGRGTQGGPTAAEINAYAHKTDNITASSKESHTLNFQPNMLNNYDVVTYHWKLFLTSLENAKNGDVLSLANQVVIAESGVSDLTIDKVEMNGIAIPSVETGTGTQTTVKFEIVEPSGAGLLDKMFYEAVSLGIGNWLVMPCFLQLEFRGRDPKTSSADLTGAPGTIGSMRWLWPIKLTNAKANVTTVGTRYEFDAIVYNELAQSNSYFGIQHNLILREIDTFEGAMKDLARKINADQLEKLIDNYSIPDTYKIVIDPIFQGKAGTITPPKNNNNTSRGGDYVKFDKKTATYNTGTTIDKIIDSLLGNTAYYQEKMQGAPAPAAKPGTSNTEPDQMKKFWRVVTETHPIAYDSLRQDNAVEITIFVIEYDTGVMDVNPSQTGQTPDSIGAAKKRIVEYANKRIFNKIYNYMFTGLNDQVISFDLNMNFSFAASLSRFGGIYSNTATQNGEGVTNQKHAEEEKNLTTQLRQTLQFVNNASPQDSKKVDAKISEMKKSLDNSKLDPTTRARYNTILSNAKSADKVGTNLQGTGGLNANGTIADPVKSATSLAVPKNNMSPAFISDVQLSSEGTKQAYQTMLTNRKGKLRPIPYREGVQESNLGFGIDQASDAGRNRVSSVFATALYSSLDASLQHVKINIKGDPYWLFPQPITGEKTKVDYNSYIAKSNPAQAITNIKDAHKTIRDSVNLFGTDNFIVIRFRTPRIYNETTGIIDPFTDAEMFSGVYKVITIVSKFEVGKFTQELTCLLDPVINITDLQGFLKEIETTQGYRPAVLDAQVAADARTNFAKVDPRRLDIANPDRVNNLPGQIKGPIIPNIKG